jgi:hypothetical protein
MNTGCLKFASTAEACAYLSELLGARLLIGSVTPKNGDIVIFYHPKADMYYAAEYDKSLVEGEGNRKGFQNLTSDKVLQEFSGNDSENKIGQYLRDVVTTPWVVEQKRLQQENGGSFQISSMPDFIWADSLSKDQELMLEGEDEEANKSKSIGFNFSRKYAPFGSNFSQEKNLAWYTKNPKRAIERSQKTKAKNPTKDHKDLMELSAAEIEAIVNPKPEFTSQSKKKSIFKEENSESSVDKNPGIKRKKNKISPMITSSESVVFASEEEAFQYLADITGSKIKINN